MIGLWPSGLYAVIMFEPKMSDGLPEDCLLVEAIFGIARNDLEICGCPGSKVVVIPETGLVRLSFDSSFAIVKFNGSDGKGELLSVPVTLTRLNKMKFTFDNIGEEYFIAIWNDGALLPIPSELMVSVSSVRKELVS